MTAHANRQRAAILCALVLFGCAVMTLADGVLHLPYAAKSAVKLVCFLLLPLLFARRFGGAFHSSLMKVERRALVRALGLGAGVFAVIFGAYLLLRGVVDFSGITALLGTNAGVTAENFWRVALYISFVNSLLEEFFFRSIAFLALRTYTGEGFAHAFSTLSFALYHTAMLLGWFPLPIFLLALAGLAVGGALFNALDAKSGTIFPSWAVHIFANLAINTVGFLLFGIIG